MKIVSNIETTTEIKKILESQAVSDKNVRIYIAGMG